MEIKTHPSMTVLYSAHQTTIPQLINFVGIVAKELYAEAAKNDVLVSGPQYWIYRGMDGKDDTVFTLEIAMPIQGEVKSGKFKVKQLAPYKSVAHMHTGKWEDMPASYGQLLQYIEQNKIAMTDECREVYLNVDFVNPENNRVEIQMGIV
jgi:effector-binding domain-containing protein